MMSGVFVIGIVLSSSGLLVPIPLMALESSTGAVQAYIFGASAMVFIGGNDMNWIHLISIIGAALAISLGAIAPASAQGKAVAAAMDAIARQPEAAATVSRTSFVGSAMIETMAIYCSVVALSSLFANPFA
ncbi:hypothetical protein OY671_010118 [Metschnikowia pulcherrima]|nr:hypothetical protein OY671_010118 [Metschnikowia pulcherrima]